MDEQKLTAEEKENLLKHVTKVVEKDILIKVDMYNILTVCSDAIDREMQRTKAELRAAMVIEGGKQRGKE